MRHKFEVIFYTPDIYNMPDDYKKYLDDLLKEAYEKDGYNALIDALERYLEK